MKKLIGMITMMAVLGIAVTLAKGPEAETNLNAALAKAKKEGKMLFVQFGRESCGNCQALKGMINAGDVKLSERNFVYADVNCDDRATSQLFRSKFKVQGRTLPFVVIADSDGKQLAARSGYGSADEFKRLIKDAQKMLKTPQK
ncbi:MAG: thioredoxin family protein [Verrucomicrobia bacterium]|nr:thioredoxin family protein [Verrucomicrobiota bacterium]